jgi:PIN domain nuclease of toxin-antitoxin system
MRLLLDTHVALWAVTDSPRLSATGRKLIDDRSNEIFISAATLWEIAIKHALPKRGRGAMPISAETARKYFQRSGYASLAMTAEHACEIEQLPNRHADPFDRMLISQARIEPMRLLTHDKRLLEYGEMVVCV